MCPCAPCVRSADLTQLYFILEGVWTVAIITLLAQMIYSIYQNTQMLLHKPATVLYSAVLSSALS